MVTLAPRRARQALRRACGGVVVEGGLAHARFAVCRTVDGHNGVWQAATHLAARRAFGTLWAVAATADLTRGSTRLVLECARLAERANGKADVAGMAARQARRAGTGVAAARDGVGRAGGARDARIAATCTHARVVRSGVAWREGLRRAGGALDRAIPAESDAARATRAPSALLGRAEDG